MSNINVNHIGLRWVTRERIGGEVARREYANDNILERGNCLLHKGYLSPIGFTITL